MGNLNSHKHHQSSKRKSKLKEDDNTLEEETIAPHPKPLPTSILRLFEKLELTADEENNHPGEITRGTFEKAFHGPLHTFGKLMYQQMKNGRVNNDRITREQFVAAGTEIVSKMNIADQRQYYFRLYASGKDYLTKEDAFQMVHVSFMLTLSVSKIQYTSDEQDLSLFESMVAGMFGIQERITCSEFETWSLTHCPNIFSGVHAWVCMVLNSSNLPKEMEERTVRVPMFDTLTGTQQSMCVGMAWVLSSVLPNVYTQIAPPTRSASAPNDPLLNSYYLLVNMARLPRVQCWTLLFNSDKDGLSQNRFTHHVMSYNGPNLTLLNFEGRNQYCLALETGWKEGTSKFGGADSRLIQLMPVYRVIQAGPKLAMLNTMSRNARKGIHMGVDERPLVICVDEDFDKVYHFDVPCALHRIEVWGCGGEATKQAQLKQKTWEAQDIERQKMRKLKLEGDWRDTPDKQILEWGGVRTGSSYTADR